MWPLSSMHQGPGVSAGERLGRSSERRCPGPAINPTVNSPVRADLMLIQFERPLIGSKYGLGDKDITKLILSPKFPDSSLFPINEWPCQVFIARILDYTVIRTLTITTRGQVQIIGKGTVFRTLDEANAYARRFYS